jgi:SRSO17 transposase
VPFAFVAADSVYGTGAIETMLRKAGKGYVLGVAASRVLRSCGKPQLVNGTAAQIAQNLPQRRWAAAVVGRRNPRDHACMPGPISN